MQREFSATSGPNLTVDHMKHLTEENVAESFAEQVASTAAFRVNQEESVNPFARLQRAQKSIKARGTRLKKTSLAGEKGQRLAPIEQIKDNAHQFQQRNPELRAAVLISLRDQIKPGDTKEDILNKVKQFYEDVSLADEAFEFLLETTEGELYQTVQAAKQEYRSQFEREITAGRNIGAQAREASDKGIGTPTNLRDLYRSFSGNPQEAPALFEELSKKYAFADLKKVTNFLLHSLGADLKSKGPSIPPGLRHNLLAETRSLQAILGVYRFFKMRMGLMEKLFSKADMAMPQQLSFESMAKQFMSIASERYPSADKVKQSAVRLGIEKWISAKIIAFSQFRDAVREVAVNQIYSSIQHRDELYLAILEALEDLEDELEEFYEQGDENSGQDSDQDSDDSDDGETSIEKVNF